MIVWVQLPALKVHFYHKEVLMTLGNLIGRTIKLDYHTLNRQRRKFARIAVEVDMSKPLVPRIWLDGAWQKVEYENLPTVCFECGKIGHNSSTCPTLRAAETSDQLAIVVGGEAPAPATTEAADSNPGFGPWMLVTKKSRRNPRDQSKKGNLGNDLGREITGQLNKNGKGWNKNKEGGESPNHNVSAKPLGSQRKTSHERKGASPLDDSPGSGKAKNKGKEIVQEGNESNKGILGSRPTQGLGKTNGPRPTTVQNRASTSATSLESLGPVGDPIDLDTVSPMAVQAASPIKLKTASPPVHTVLGTKGTKIQIISLHNKSEQPQEPDIKKPTIGSRTKHKNEAKQKSKKGTPVKQQVNKILQVWSPIKERKGRSKARLASLTLQEINAWTSAAQKEATMAVSEIAELTIKNQQDPVLEVVAATPPSQ
ncbi:unnamed protein product [Linum trigynum]|uniref:CCHC-type domain-containing protein n=1 Tax=Linum trigynum TaxID=586398 RepID=A0AAV2CBF2_9ROSI